MIGLVQRYARWLHTRWPAGTVEKLPRVRPDFRTNVPGVFVVGDLTGIPLLKFSADSGARAVGAIAADPALARLRTEAADPTIVDVAIVGAGVSGMSAALEAKAKGLSYVVLEGSEPFSTIVNFPKAKPIYTYPTSMTPAGRIQFQGEVKESLVEELRAQTAGVPVRLGRVEKIARKGRVLEVVIPGEESLLARRVVIAIGRSGNFRKLGVPGEDLTHKVVNRLHDPKEFADRDVLVVGGGDSALEAAVALVQAGARVTLSYRKREFSRPKPENVERLEALRADPAADVPIETPTSERQTTTIGRYYGKARRPGTLSVRLATRVVRIEDSRAVLAGEDGPEEPIANDAVFAMIGREPPLDFFRRSGIEIAGEMRVRQWFSLALFLIFCFALYSWKSGDLKTYFHDRGWFPFDMPARLGSADPSTLAGTIRLGSSEPGFWYSLLYCSLVVGFGVRRIRRRKTRYVTVQTCTLAAIQCVPLFLLPYVFLPWLGHNGAFDSGWGASFADALFPRVDYDPHGREYWRAVGFILAWPLFVWNAFTGAPMWWWLGIGFVQTFVLLPLAIRRWGKGVYCGWICSCGALAETMGDEHRHKMPHGAGWNRVNMVGQVVLGVAFVLLALRIVSWTQPPDSRVAKLYAGLFTDWQILGLPLNYRWVVDFLLAGVIGVGFYFWASGRVWCRFACPLAALMHVYARFTQFRILADKKKCISCNVCTSVCHQGIDIMNFANKGLPMADPECVRCSACVQSCPTGVLEFGRIDLRSGEVIARDRLSASPVVASEGASR